ncbi:MAG: PPOX class F420-dependent oxidoreductase [Candidatus Dormiibacterota bacterium]
MPNRPLPAALREFMEAPNLVSVATVGRDGAPQATVVWFLLEGERILINTKAGRVKALNLERDPRVAMTVFDCANPYRSVQLRGVVVERRDGASAAEDIHRLSRHYVGQDYREPEDRISYLIAVNSWSSWGMPELE